jgi:hypothetical protein
MRNPVIPAPDPGSQSAIVGVRPANWVRFAHFASGRTKLGSFCAFCLRHPPPAGPNWVRFARFISRPSRAPHENRLSPHTPAPPSLASFRTIPSINRLRRGEIGFVSHASVFRRAWPRPDRGSGVPARRLPLAAEIGFVLHICPRRDQIGFLSNDFLRRPPPAGDELGSFCTFHSPADPRPPRQPPLSIYPSLPKFGFVLHNFVRQPPAAVGNWVRFAHSAFGVRLRPASSNPQSCHGERSAATSVRDLGPLAPNWVRFARFHSPAEPRPTRQSPLRISPSLPKFGFVLHNLLRQLPAARRNWVRFARFDSS